MYRHELHIITWLCGFWREMTSIFHGSGLNQATYARRQIISCVIKASACHHTLHADHWHCLWKIPPIIAVKSNVTTFIQVLRIVVKYVIVAGLLSPYLNTPISKAWGSASRAQRSLKTGIVRRQFPLRGTTRRNNGRSAWNSSRFEHICAFYVEITNIHGWNWKCHVIIVIKTGSGEVCCPNALGLVRTVCQIPRANALGI